MNNEAVQMGVGPAECALDMIVEKGDRDITTDEEAAPDERTDGAKANAEPVDLRPGGDGHTAPHDIRATDRGAVLSGRRREKHYLAIIPKVRRRLGRHSAPVCDGLKR
jgi:hypothetical protein